MITPAIIRGVVAGMLAGLLAGLFAVAFAEPSIDAAIALEEAAAAEAPESDVPDAGQEEEPGISRTAQKIGLVVGTSLYGAGIGALFGVAAAWARGRVGGDAWTRALTLGGAVAGAVVVLPAIAYPPNPPAVGDPETVATRTSLYLVTCVIGVALAVGAWFAARRLAERGWSRAAVQVTVAVGVIAVAAGAVALLPTADGAGAFPADLLWQFRLSSLGTQLILVLGTAVGYGLMTVRSERPERERRTAPA